MSQPVNSGSSYVLVQDPKTVAELATALAATSRVGIDTEGDSLHHYFEKVCLIQLSFQGKHFVIDPLSGIDLSKFFEALAQKELIFQGADYDLRMLKKSFGFRPGKPVFDTMIAAQLLGYEKIGLAALAEKFCFVSMSKTGQKADWSKRPLTEGLLRYASDDTKYLETIADAQMKHLQELGRVPWHVESCERVVRICGLPEKNEGKEDAWRIKGSSLAHPDSLVFIREIWKWRDETAQKKDRPPFMVLRNEDILEIAAWRVKHPHAPLNEGPVFLKRLKEETFAGIKKAIQDAENTPPSQWPLPREKRPWNDDRPDLDKLEPLMAACKTLAAQLKIEPSVLASRAMLTALALHKPKTLEAVMETGGMMKWQAELLLPSIKNIL